MWLTRQVCSGGFLDDDDHHLNGSATPMDKYSKHRSQLIHTHLKYQVDAKFLRPILFGGYVCTIERAGDPGWAGTSG